MRDDITRSIISRYNFSRRVVDHRMYYDFNYALNKPILSKAWWGTAKNRLIGSIVNSFGPYVSGGVLIVGGILVTIDTVWRMNTPHESHISQGYFTPTQNFFNYNNDFNSSKGKWNHNFACWENDKNCGRDYDWIKKTKESA